MRADGDVMRRATMQLVIRLALLIVLSPCWPVYAQAPTLRAERELFAAVNQARQSADVPPLRWDEALATAARRHAEIMAEHGSAQHGFAGEPSLLVRVKQTGARFTWLSENVVHGPMPELIHSQFMKSSLHRSNILDKDMDSIGIGVVERGGQLFTVEDFSQAR
jgi:uncharacterized protein YkwD